MTDLLKRNGLLLLAALALVGCKSDDDGYNPVSIETSPDTAVVAQNSTISINVLANDANVPQLGSLSAAGAQQGALTIIDGGTPDDPSDDLVQYAPNGTFFGDDSFTYTICDDDTPFAVCAQCKLLLFFVDHKGVEHV